MIESLDRVGRRVMQVVVPKPLRDSLQRLIYWRITGRRYGRDMAFDENHRPLWDWVEAHGCKNILEIGLGDGRNAARILSIARGCNYFCFDDLSDPASVGAFAELRDNGNVKFYIGDSRETLPAALGELPVMDLIFIDGGHDYGTVRSDWGNCKRLMGPNTACFFHDCELLGVWRALREIGCGFSVRLVDPGGFPLFALVTKKGRRRR